MIRHSLFAALLLTSASAFAQSAPATPAPAAANAPITREQLPALVREAIMNDPEIIKDAIQKLREKAESEARMKTVKGLADNKEALYNDPASPAEGPANADVTVVEFFDYNCGHCRNVVSSVSKALETDKKLRFIFKEMPIFGGDSDKAAKAALAVHAIAKDKYFKFHQALMTYKGNANEKAIMDIAKDLGINAEKLKTEMAKPEIAAQIAKNHELAEKIGIRGTPAFIIGDEMIPGEIPLEAMKAKIAKLREGNPKAAGK